MKVLSQHIADLLTNSINANAKNIVLDLRLDFDNLMFNIIVKDDGKGIKEKNLEQIFNPFTRVKKNGKLGLGLSLFKQACLRCSGDVEITSKQGEGTVVNGKMHLESENMTPPGDIGGTLLNFVETNEKINFTLRVVCGDNIYFFNSTDYDREYEKWQLKIKSNIAKLMDVAIEHD